MKEMQKLQPRMAKIREKYKDNQEQLNKEMMGLYKTYKVNPMGGCLPMVIQIPVFFALFRILGSAIELRHAPFMLWINDLSAPDRLFSFSLSDPVHVPALRHTGPDAADGGLHVYSAEDDPDPRRSRPRPRS